MEFRDATSAEEDFSNVTLPFDNVLSSAHQHSMVDAEELFEEVLVDVAEKAPQGVVRDESGVVDATGDCSWRPFDG